MKFWRANYPSTTLLLNVHVDRFPGIVVLHHLRLQEERDEGGVGKELYILYFLEDGAGQELYISYLLEGGEGQVQEIVQHGTPAVQSHVK